MPMTNMMPKIKILFTVVLPFDTLGEPLSFEENRTKRKEKANISCYMGYCCFEHFKTEFMWNQINFKELPVGSVCCFELL